MFNNILSTIEYCVYHLCIVAASRVSKIPARRWAKRQDQLMSRYIASMNEVRTLKAELIRVKGKGSPVSLKLRCAQALAYLFTNGDTVYHNSYLSTTVTTARNWACKFRHPFQSKIKTNLGGRPKITEEIIQLILTLKQNNRSWGGQRIHDELLKMGIQVSPNTISNILKENGFDPSNGKAGKWKKWQGEFRDHIWACDFFLVETLKSICMVYILIDTFTKEILALRVHEGREGIDTFWVAGTIAQTMSTLKRHPQQLIHDRDPLFMGQVIRLCAVCDIKELKVPPRFPTMNSYAERAIQSTQFELTHHIWAKDGDELQKYLDEYVLWFNNHRPHQGIGGQTPKNFAEGKGHPEIISIEELRQKKLEKITFANGLLQAYRLADKLEKAA